MKGMPVNTFFLKWVREEKLNMNQKEFGELLGVSINTIQNWEKGKNNPQYKYISQLATIVALDPNAFYEDTRKKIHQDLESIWFRWLDEERSRDFQEEFTLHDMLRIGDFLGYKVTVTKEEEEVDLGRPLTPAEKQMKDIIIGHATQSED